MALELVHDTFLGIDPASCALDGSRVVLLRVPYDGTTSYGAGTRHGPAAIMAASAQVELLDLELGRETAALGIHTPPALAPSALGPEAMVDQVEEACGSAVAAGKFVVTLGGEHTVALGAARALARSQAPFSILQIDAHLDLRESYEGSRYSHASVARRLLELGPVFPVGVRVACPEELEVLDRQGIRPVWGHEAQAQSQQEWIDRVVDGLLPRVYVTLDVDGLDPSVIPGTGTPVPGGLGWYQTLALLRAVGQRRQVIGCDCCELAPIPGQQASEFAAALLVYKMIGYFAGEEPSSR